MLNKLFGKKETPKKDSPLKFIGGSEIYFDIFWLQREIEFQLKNSLFNNYKNKKV